MTVEIDRWLLGVRTDSDVVRAALEAEHAGHLVNDPSPPPGFAVVASGDSPRRGVRPLGTLRVGNDEVLRSRSDGRLARALLNALDGYARPATDLMTVGAAAVIRHGVAVLLPARWLWAAGVEGSLRGSRTTVLDTTVVRVAPEPATIRGVGWDLDRDCEVDVQAPVVAWLLQRRPMLIDDHNRASSLVATAALDIVGAGATSAADAQMSLEHVPHLLDLVHMVDSDPDVRSIVRLIERGLTTAHIQS